MEPRELATVIASLRLWQAAMTGARGPSFHELADLVATDQGTLRALSAAEIDELCQRLQGNT